MSNRCSFLKPVGGSNVGCDFGGADSGGDELCNAYRLPYICPYGRRAYRRWATTHSTNIITLNPDPNPRYTESHFTLKSSNVNHKQNVARRR